MTDSKMPELLKDRLDELSAGANPGPYGVESYGSGTTYLTLGRWVGHYASDTVPMMGGGRAEIVNSNVPSEWGEKSRKGFTAAFLAELANAYRDGKICVCGETHPAPVADAELDELITQLMERCDHRQWDPLCASAADTITALRARTAQPVGVITVQDAAKDAREVFSESCDHTKQAIDYMEQVLLAALLPEGGAHG